jgi:hypothetical protein
MLLPVIALLVLSACSGGPTTYQPAAGGDRGFSEMRIEQDRYRVRFAAGGDIGFDRAEDYALRRAAEITLREGGEWFQVVARTREGNDRNPVGVGGSLGRSWGSDGFRASAVGIGLRIDGSAGEKEVTLEILIRSGPRADSPQAYDARAVLEHIPD